MPIIFSLQYMARVQMISIKRNEIISFWAYKLQFDQLFGYNEKNKIETD